MNTCASLHIPGEVLEKYSLGILPDVDSAPLDEHLLICPTCQRRLEEIDDYVRVMKAATAAMAGTPRSKPCGRADRLTSVES